MQKLMVFISITIDEMECDWPNCCFNAYLLYIPPLSSTLFFHRMSILCNTFSFKFQQLELEDLKSIENSMGFMTLKLFCFTTITTSGYFFKHFDIRYVKIHSKIQMKFSAISNYAREWLKWIWIVQPENMQWTVILDTNTNTHNIAFCSRIKCI